MLGHRGSGDGNGWVGWDIDKIPARWENVLLKEDISHDKAIGFPHGCLRNEAPVRRMS